MTRFHQTANKLFVLPAELIAAHIGIIQRLVSTYHLHEVNPYTWLVDVLQRFARAPSRQ